MVLLACRRVRATLIARGHDSDMNEDAVIVVVGVGSAELEPDRVRAVVGVSTVATTVGQALSDAAVAQERMVNVAADAGIERSLVQTVGYHVGPDYDSRGGPSRQRADASLSLAIDDMARAGALIAEMSEAVGDSFRIHAVRPESSDVERGRSVAREAAVRAARRQAEELAAAAGVELGRLRSLVEDAGTHRIERVAGATLMAATSGAPGVEGGTLSVSVAVTATYELSP